MASAVLAPIVRRAFDQRLGGKFRVATSAEFNSRGSAVPASKQRRMGERQN